MVATGAYALVAVAAAIAAYLAVFTVWAPYDDEGTVLVTLQAFAGGETLYRDVYTPYGPFYFELFGGLLALSGQQITTDASRTIVIVLWIGTSFLLGLAAQRLTGRLLLGVAAMLTSFGALGVLSHEPMHPQGLSVLLLGAFVLLAVVSPTRRPLWAGAAGGALLAALFLTKLNLGAYALAAVAVAAALTAGPLRRRRWLGWPIVLAFLAMPVVIASRDLGLGWVRELVGVQMLAMTAIVVAGWSLGRPSDETDGGTVRWLLGAVAGFATAFVAIVAAIVAAGSSPADVYGGVVTEALRVRDVVVSQLPMSSFVPALAVLAAGAAALTLRRRSGAVASPTIWPGLLRAAAGLAIWISAGGITPAGLETPGGNPISLPAVLAWVAAVPPAGVVEPPYRRFLRVLLPALAVAEALQVYPVAGSQIGIAALLFVPVGALCLADALTSLRAWSAARGGRTAKRLGVAVAVLIALVVVNFAVNSIAAPIQRDAAAYRERMALPFDGADRLHLLPYYFGSYTGLVRLLHEHRCTDFVGLPNVNSLYLWSGIEPPRPYAPGAWPEALDEPRQRRIVEQLRASPRPCAIRNDDLAALWLAGKTPADKPLVRFLLEDFRPVAEVGGFQFMLPAERLSPRPRPN